MKYFMILFILCPVILTSCAKYKTNLDNTVSKPSIRQIVKENGYKTTVYFEVSSSELNIISADAIMKAAKLLAISQTKAYLTGHADKTGFKEKNAELSERRVKTVKDYLLQLGVKKDNIYIDYFGDEKPIEQGDDIEAYAKNRRVEVVLTNDAKAENKAVSLEEQEAAVAARVTNQEVSEEPIITVNEAENKAVSLEEQEAAVAARVTNQEVSEEPVITVNEAENSIAVQNEANGFVSETKVDDTESNNAKEDFLYDNKSESLKTDNKKYDVYNGLLAYTKP